MKNIENKSTSITKGPAKEGLSPELMKYSDIIYLVATSPTTNGMTIEDMRTRIKISDLVVSHPEIISIEDADFISLKKMLREFKWAVAHKDIVEFYSYIETL